MRNRKRNSKHTDNSRVYKMTMRDIHLGCPICPPNKGCNTNRDNEFRNWKRWRKSQWKE